MGRYSLGTATTKMDPKMNKDELYLNPIKANEKVTEMEKGFDEIQKSLLAINTLLNKAVNTKKVKGNYETVFKNWAKKCKTQANNAKARKNGLKTKFLEDTHVYTLKLLDRVSELENKVNSMSNE